jgi:hypothetical protein
MDKYYKPEVGQIYMNNSSGSLFLVIKVHEEEYSDTECIWYTHCDVEYIWSKYSSLIGQFDLRRLVRKKVNTLVC